MEFINEKTYIGRERTFYLYLEANKETIQKINLSLFQNKLTSVSCFPGQ